MTTRAVSQKAICLLIGLSCSSTGLWPSRPEASTHALALAMARAAVHLTVYLALWPPGVRLYQLHAWRLGRSVRLLCLVRCGWLCSVALVSIQLSRARDSGWWPALLLLVHDESDSQRGLPVTSHSFWGPPLVILDPSFLVCMGHALGSEADLACCYFRVPQ